MSDWKFYVETKECKVMALCLGSHGDGEGDGCEYGPGQSTCGSGDRHFPGVDWEEGFLQFCNGGGGSYNYGGSGNLDLECAYAFIDGNGMGDGYGDDMWGLGEGSGASSVTWT